MFGSAAVKARGFDSEPDWQPQSEHPTGRHCYQRLPSDERLRRSEVGSS